MTKLSPVTLRRAVQENKLDKLGALEDITKTVDVAYELKRAYRESPKTGGELLSGQYKSTPWDISVVSK